MYYNYFKWTQNDHKLINIIKSVKSNLRSKLINDFNSCFSLTPNQSKEDPEHYQTHTDWLSIASYPHYILHNYIQPTPNISNCSVSTQLFETNREGPIIGSFGCAERHWINIARWSKSWVSREHSILQRFIPLVPLMCRNEAMSLLFNSCWRHLLQLPRRDACAIGTYEAVVAPPAGEKICTPAPQTRTRVAARRPRHMARTTVEQLLAAKHGKDDYNHTWRIVPRLCFNRVPFCERLSDEHHRTSNLPVTVLYPVVQPWDCYLSRVVWVWETVSQWSTVPIQRNFPRHKALQGDGKNGDIGSQVIQKSFRAFKWHSIAWSVAMGK